MFQMVWLDGDETKPYFDERKRWLIEDVVDKKRRKKKKNKQKKKT